MNRLLLASILVPLTLSACKIGGSESTSGPVTSCMTAGNACGQNSDCCSYGCQNGLCVPNPVEGGTCRTTTDCALYRVCKSGACTTPPAGGLCRDDADVCSTWYGDAQCCSGNCVTGVCAPNHAPVAAFTVTGMDANGDVPFRAALTLLNGSTDADGDPLIYTWAITLAPAGSTATLSSSSAASPTFTPDLTGDYAVQLTVADGSSGQLGRLTASVTHAFRAVNTPPAVNAGGDRTASRNVALPLSGSVSDPDGDALTCTWLATPPGGGAPIVLAGPSACSGTFSASFTCSGTYAYPTIPASEGTWTVTLTATDGVTSVPASALVTCVNDPPVANAGPAQVWNLGAAPASNPSVPLTGAFSDPNGDGAYGWQWTLLSTPPGSAVAAGVLGDAQTASFVPDVTGRFVVQLQICDRPSSCSTSTANVDVYRHVEEFGDARVVHASDYAHGVDRVAMAGPDPASGSLGKVWLRDPAGTAAEVSAGLDAVPDAIAVTPAGDYAVAGNSLWLWVVKLSVTPPTVTRVSNPVGTLGSIALAGTEAIVFPASGSGWFYHFTYPTATSSTALTSAGFTGNVGRVDAAGAYLYVLDLGYSIERYVVSNRGGFSLTYSAYESLPYYSGISDLWASADGAHLFLSSGDIQPTSSLATTGSLGVAPWSLDSVPDGRVAALAADRLWLFNSALTHTADDLFPQWGVGGQGYVVTPDGAFIRVDPADSAKTIRYVVVHATGTSPFRSGLVRYP
jgi:hypothetical protein